MPLGIKRNFLDIEMLETGNELTLVLVDASQYIEQPDRPLLEVFLPGFDKYELVNFIPFQVNTYNSNTLNLGRTFGIGGLTVLPDGVWNLRYKICPYNFVFIDKSFLRTTILNKKINLVYNQINLTKCDTATDQRILDSLTKAEILIRGGKAIVCQDSKRAYEYYQLANRLVEKLLDTHCKNCKREWDAPVVGHQV